MHFTHSRSDGANTLAVVAATCCALQPRLHCQAPRRATATRAELISRDRRGSPRRRRRRNAGNGRCHRPARQRGETDARFKRVSGRVVELKNKRLLQLTYKRRGACDLQRNHAFLGDDGAEGTDGDLLPPKRWSARKAVKHALSWRRAREATVGATRYDLTKGSLTSCKLRPGQEDGFTRPH